MIALDTSVIVAALTSWSEKREAAMNAIAKAMSSSGGVVIPALAMFEAFSVMTRVPLAHRLSAAEAYELLDLNFAKAKIASFPANSVWALLRKLTLADLAGGIVYDAVILASAEQAGATALLTLNRRHFERLSPHIRIEEP